MLVILISFLEILAISSSEQGWRKSPVTTTCQQSSLPPASAQTTVWWWPGMAWRGGGEAGEWSTGQTVSRSRSRPGVRWGRTGIPGWRPLVLNVNGSKYNCIIGDSFLFVCKFNFHYNLWGFDNLDSFMYGGVKITIMCQFSVVIEKIKDFSFTKCEILFKATL